MAIYRFVGTTESGIFGTPYVFKKFGQRVEMDASIADPLIADGFMLLPEAAWTPLGIAEQDLNKPLREMEATLKKAWTALHDLKNPPAPSAQPPDAPAADKE